MRRRIVMSVVVGITTIVGSSTGASTSRDIAGTDPNFSYGEEFAESIVEPPPAPLPEDPENEVGHGPFVPPRLAVTARRNGTSLEFNFGCEFMIWDPDDGYWDWTYEARLKDPGGNQIKYASNWTSDKPSFTGDVRELVIDPAEGTHRCEIQWYWQNVALPLRTLTVNLTYTCTGDLERTKIRKEYNDKGITESRWPACTDLRDDYSSTYFSTSELNNNGWHTLFWSTSGFRTRIDNTRIDYGNPIGMSNGYRCPEKNASVGGGANSYHQFGRGGDFVPSGETNTQAWRNEIAELAELNGLDAVDETDHVHVEWEF